MKKNIIWRKWTDPLVKQIKSIEQEGSEVSGPPQAVLYTPMGVLGCVTDTFVANSFDFWMMYTNFSITPQIAQIIDNTHGVESLDIYTKYRARIGFPTSGLFDVEHVMQQIKDRIVFLDRQSQNQQLTGLSEDLTKKAIETRDKLDDKFEYWAMLVLPNGNIEVMCSNEKNITFDEKVKVLKTTEQCVGGKLLISND
jgi:hypothetical protein